SKNTDILIEGQKIKKIKESIPSQEADSIIDASNMIVMPGLIDTHRHNWESIVRNIGADWTLNNYMQHIYFGNIGSRLRPKDAYIANYFGALEALNAGVTTMLDWSMIQSPEHTDALIKGLQDSGIRAVFAYGLPGTEDYCNPASELTHPKDSYRVKKEYFHSNDQLLTMGLAIRGPETSSWNATVQDINMAKDLDVLCSMHLGVGVSGIESKSISKLYEHNLLSPSINIVHANGNSVEDFKMLKEFGASISVLPEVEMMMGHGYPITGKVLSAGYKPSIGVDVVTSVSGDLFSQMRFMLQAERARRNQEILDLGESVDNLSLKAKDIFEFATKVGAKDLMLDKKIGSIEEGKEADIILIDTVDFNMMPIIDSVGSVIQFANPSNVDTVIVSGKIVKRNKKLIDVDILKLKSKVYEAMEHVTKEDVRV
ncbi:hypothetical protein IIU_05960, partial [Bacillus cereus VD133]